MSKFTEILNRDDSKSSPSTEVHSNWRILKRVAFISTLKPSLRHSGVTEDPHVIGRESD